MRRRDFIRNSLAAVPVVGLGRLVDASSAPHPRSPYVALQRYAENPTPANARAVTSLLPVESTSPLSAPFTESVDKALPAIETQIEGRDIESARLAFRLHGAVHLGSVASCVNEVIGKIVLMDPERFLELLLEHSHLIGNRKILLNLGLEYVDEYQRQDREVSRRANLISSVDRPDLAAVQRETLEVLYGHFNRCSR